jgi:hypothetical protein
VFLIFKVLVKVIKPLWGNLDSGASYLNRLAIINDILIGWLAVDQLVVWNLCFARSRHYFAEIPYLPLKVSAYDLQSSAAKFGVKDIISDSLCTH